MVDELACFDVRLSFHQAPSTSIKKKSTVRDLLGAPLRLNLFKPFEIKVDGPLESEYPEECFESSTEDEEDSACGLLLGENEGADDCLIEAAPALRPDQVGYWKSIPLTKQPTDDFYIELIGSNSTAPAKLEDRSSFKGRMSMAPPPTNLLEEEKGEKKANSSSSKGSFQPPKTDRSFSSYQTS